MRKLGLARRRGQSSYVIICKSFRVFLTGVHQYQRRKELDDEDDDFDFDL